jgi:hypothetical protein
VCDDRRVETRSLARLSFLLTFVVTGVLVWQLWSLRSDVVRLERTVRALEAEVVDARSDAYAEDQKFTEAVGLLYGEVLALGGQVEGLDGSVADLQDESAAFERCRLFEFEDC